MSDSFQLVSPYSPAGDQPDAIAKLTSNFEAGVAKQTLLGVTGSARPTPSPTSSSRCRSRR